MAKVAKSFQPDSSGVKNLAYFMLYTELNGTIFSKCIDVFNILQLFEENWLSGWPADWLTDMQNSALKFKQLWFFIDLSSNFVRSFSSPEASSYLSISQKLYKFVFKAQKFPEYSWPLHSSSSSIVVVISDN